MRLDEGLATIITIGDDATDQAKEKERHEPYQPEQAKVNRVPCELEHLPSDCHALDLGPGLRESLRAPNQAEIAVAQHAEGALVTRQRLDGRLASAHMCRFCRR